MGGWVFTDGCSDFSLLIKSLSGNSKFQPSAQLAPLDVGLADIALSIVDVDRTEREKGESKVSISTAFQHKAYYFQSYALKVTGNVSSH